MPDATRPLSELSLLQTLHSKEVTALGLVVAKARRLDAITPNPVPNTVAVVPPLDATLQGVAKVRLAALYDSARVKLLRCLPIVKNRIPPLKPAPTPDATRPLSELSLLQTLLINAVTVLESDSIKARTLPLKLATPNPPPNISVFMTPVEAVLLDPKPEVTGAS